MLSESAGARLSKPRPPGVRRPSGRQQAPSGDQPALAGAAASSSTLQPSSLLNRAVHSSPGRTYERDLDLDLPVDLAAALGRTSHSAWPAHPRRRSSTATGEASGSPAGSASADAAAAGGSLGRRLGRKLSRALLSAADEHAQAAPDSDGAELPSLNLPSDGLRSDDTVRAGQPDECDARSDEDLDEELDEEWVGGLPREELEALLKQANQVIRERERDLGIAAAIGKALLDKNISLRSKHVGILTRLSSTINLNEQATYSPPTTDIDCNSQRGDLDDDETPMPTPTLSDDYFASQQAAGLPHSREHSGASPQRRPALDSVFARPTTPQSRPWQPSQAGLIASGPSSPANSQHSTVSHRHRKTSSSLSANAIAAAAAADAQRQLEMLSSQNDVLLAQLAELQDEAEEAKAAGSRRLRKLNREIEGLRGELEAATSRNDELERSGETASADSVAEQKRKQWRRRLRHEPWSMTDMSDSAHASESSLPAASPSSARLSAMLKADTERMRTDESAGGAAHDELGMPPSLSSAILGQTHGESASERALVAQLLAKIKELEDTNAALAQAGTEMDGRLGRALQEGERIRDAYDAVEASSAYGGDETFNETQHSLGGLSPSALRRRAAGNRHIIEGRRTIRAALRRQVSGDLSRSSTGSSLASSAASSAASSPRAFRKGRLGSGLTRPRILITPSMEDLAARRRQDEEWEEQQPFSAASLGPNDARKYGAAVSRKLRRASSSGSMASDGDASRSSIELPMHGMTASHSAASSIDEAMSESATSVWNAGHTLGSELGDTSLQFSNELAHWTQAASGAHADDGDMQLSELGKPASNPSPARLGRLLRPVASASSLLAGGAPSEAAESDIADLRWSVSSASTVVAAPQRLLTAGGDADQMMVPSLDFELQRQLSSAADGEWPDPDEELVPRGALRDDVMTNHETYDLLESATRLRPVHWADDDDFGQPITESEARRLGLLAAAKKSRTSLLGWVKNSDSASSRRTGKGKMREGLPVSSSYRQIESAEQIEERDRLTDLLRQKRLDGLKARVLAGQMDADKAVALGLDAEDADSAMARSLDREATARALAISPARHRRAMQQRQSPQQQQQRSVGRRVGAAMARQQSYASPTKGKAATSSSELVRCGGAEASDADDKTGGSSDEQFELLDLDPSRQPSRRGMNFFPVDTRARYKPAMVKQRVKVASHDAATWATTWVSFTLMVVFAFLVTIRRGPKQLGAGTNSAILPPRP